ncbi:MAG: HD domain-containing protein [Desulfobacterales bacterium]|nr:HD domain-containing protein [Desulfobacterales bacterium]
MNSLGAHAAFIPESSSECGEKVSEPAPPVEKENGSGYHDYVLKQLYDTKVTTQTKDTFKGKLWQNIESVNKELWLLLSMFAIAGLMNYLVASQKILLGLYMLPTILSAYFFGRRHATLTAFASILLVGILLYINPSYMTSEVAASVDNRWYDILSWGCILIIMAYAMGTLYDRNKKKMEELRSTYHGVIIILRHFISQDKYTESHCYRVSVYAVKIAGYLGLSPEKIEDIRAAAMLHDLGKLDVSRELLHKAAKLSNEEFDDMKTHVGKGGMVLENVRSPLGRVLPIILAHHEKYDGSGYYGIKGNAIVLEARILAVADVYDALASDRPYRKAMSPFEAKEIIVNGSGKDFDPVVVKAFQKAFKNDQMDVPNIMI